MTASDAWNTTAAVFQPEIPNTGPARAALPFRDIAGLLSDCFARGAGARVKVHGRSMRPFISHGDIVELFSCRGRILRAGDIVLVKRRDDSYVLHRITRITVDRFYLSGDAQPREEGPLFHNQAVAVALAVIREDRIIPLDQGFRRWAGCFWGKALPARTFLLSRRQKVPVRCLITIWRLFRPPGS